MVTYWFTRFFRTPPERRIPHGPTPNQSESESYQCMVTAIRKPNAQNSGRGAVGSMRIAHCVFFILSPSCSDLSLSTTIHEDPVHSCIHKIHTVPGSTQPSAVSHRAGDYGFGMPI